MDASGAPASAGYANWPMIDFREALASQGAEIAKRWIVDVVIAFTLHVIGLHDDNRRGICPEILLWPKDATQMLRSKYHGTDPGISTCNVFAAKLGCGF